jgi:spermidine synthase
LLPWSLIATATMPGGGGELRLMQRGAEFSIRVGQFELMNSRLSGSEEALAKLTCERLDRRKRPRILIGGLGMGFTLRAALAELGPESQIDVAELVPAVVAWARGPLAGIFGTSLADDRVRVYEEDVGTLIGSSRSRYDAILLDVDNGPEGLTREANDNLYDMVGLAAHRGALCAGGVLAVWSSSPDRGFSQRLRRSNFAVTEWRIPANGSRGGAKHTIWIARKATGDAPRPERKRRS